MLGSIPALTAMRLSRKQKRMIRVCGEKRRYSSQEEAYEKNTRPYFCTICGGWHRASLKKKEIKKQQREEQWQIDKKLKDYKNQQFGKTIISTAIIRCANKAIKELESHKVRSEFDQGCLVAYKNIIELCIKLNNDIYSN